LANHAEHPGNNDHTANVLAQRSGAVDGRTPDFLVFRAVIGEVRRCAAAEGGTAVIFPLRLSKKGSVRDLSF